MIPKSSLIFKKHKEVLVCNAKISHLFIVADLNLVILAFADEKEKLSPKGPSIYFPSEARALLPLGPWSLKQ